MRSVKQRESMLVKGENAKNIRDRSAPRTTKWDIAVLERDDRVHVTPLGPLRTLQIGHASTNEIGKATRVQLGEPDMASLEETEEGQDDVFVGAIRNVAGALNAEAVKLRHDVGPGNQGLC